jgi:hypothetical protein
VGSNELSAFAAWVKYSWQEYRPAGSWLNNDNLFPEMSEIGVSRNSGFIFKDLGWSLIKTISQFQTGHSRKNAPH